MPENIPNARAGATCSFLKDWTDTELGSYYPGSLAPSISDVLHTDLTLTHELIHWELTHSAFGIFLRLLDFLADSRRLSHTWRRRFGDLYGSGLDACWRLHEGTATYAEVNYLDTMKWAIKVSSAPYHLRGVEVFLDTIPDAYRRAMLRIERAVRRASPPPVARQLAMTLGWCALNSDVLTRFHNLDLLTVAAFDEYLRDQSPDRRHQALLHWLQTQPRHCRKMGGMMIEYLRQLHLPAPAAGAGQDPVLKFLSLPGPQRLKVHYWIDQLLKGYVRTYGPKELKIEKDSEVEIQAAALIQSWQAKLATWFHRRPLKSFSPVPERVMDIEVDVLDWTRYGVPGGRRPAFKGPFDLTDGDGLCGAVARAVDAQLELLVTFYPGREEDRGQAPGDIALAAGDLAVYLQSWDPNSGDRLGLQPSMRLAAAPSRWQVRRFRACLRRSQSPAQQFAQALSRLDPLAFQPDGARRAFQVTCVRYVAEAELIWWRWFPDHSKDASLRFYLIEPCSVTQMAVLIDHLVRASGLFHLEVKQGEGSLGVVVVVKPVLADDFYCGFLSKVGARAPRAGGAARAKLA